MEIRKRNNMTTPEEIVAELRLNVIMSNANADVLVRRIAAALAASEQPCSMCGIAKAVRHLCMAHYDEYKALQVKHTASKQ
jgi:hypothetical protein